MDIKSPIKTLQSALEKLLRPFLAKFISLSDRINEYIREPDKVVAKDDTITEYYGEKKVVYKYRGTYWDNEWEIERED